MLWLLSTECDMSCINILTIHNSEAYKTEEPSHDHGKLRRTLFTHSVHQQPTTLQNCSRGPWLPKILTLNSFVKAIFTFLLLKNMGRSSLFGSLEEVAFSRQEKPKRKFSSASGEASPFEGARSARGFAVRLLMLRHMPDASRSRLTSLAPIHV